MSRRSRAHALRVMVQTQGKTGMPIAVRVPQAREDSKEFRGFVMVRQGEDPSVQTGTPARSVRFSRAKRQARAAGRKLYMHSLATGHYVRVF
jgi:hypothetical protein